jgi:hypothetical protein|tara:strand:+ start:750 stop:1118 length:369 start_codon:yes stop_codon:yes gene_type:complete
MEVLMKKNFIYIICFCLTFSIFFKAHAKSNVVFLIGDKFLSMCKDKELINQSACEGYILGVQDSISSGHLSNHFDLCFPDGVTPKKLRLNIINFLEVLPSMSKFSADNVVAKFLELNYKCKK